MDYKMNIPPPYQNPTNYTPPQPGYPPLEYGQQPTPLQPMYQPQPSYNGFPPSQQAPFSTPFQQPYNPSGMAPQHPHVPYESGAVGGVGQFQPIGPIKSYQSFCGHITLACFVFWCCGCLCGCIAFILARKFVKIRLAKFLYFFQITNLFSTFAFDLEWHSY